MIPSPRAECSVARRGCRHELIMLNEVIPHSGIILLRFDSCLSGLLKRDSLGLRHYFASEMNRTYFLAHCGVSAHRVKASAGKLFNPQNISC